jgi:hypothetical protein
MHKFSKALMAGSVYMLLSVGTHADTNNVGADISALMTPEQYKAAGLDKLSAAEREALYHWLQHYAGKPATTPAAALPAATATGSTKQAAANTTAAKAMPEPVAPDSVSVAAQSAAVAAATPPPAAEKIQANNEGQIVSPAIDENFGLPDPRDEAEAAYQLHATVQEPFRGWSGKTVFYLDNGQIWKQRTSGRHTYSGDDNRVVISENRMGFFEMRLIAVDRAIGVKRLK